VDGAWWPRLITIKNPEEVTTGTTKITVTALSKTDFAAAMASALEKKSNAILLTNEPEKIEQSKLAVREGKAKLEDRWVLIRYFASSQEWDKVDEQLQAMASLVPGRPGLDLIRVVVLQQSRHNDEVKNLLMELARGLAKRPREADYAIANQLLNYSQSL